MPQNLEKQ